MNYFSFLFLILGYISTLNSENWNEESREGQPVALRSSQTNNSSTIAGESVSGAGLSSETLSELNTLAKNISHSKGIYRETDKSLEDEQEVRRSFLKKITVASESDTMKNILKRIYLDENKLQLLSDLEFLLHQYDVAVNFASVGGLEIITPLLFSSDDEIASLVARVLGTAMQSNPTVQDFALKHDIGRKLFNLLSHKSPNVLSRILFAISSLLRNAPEAQKQFLAMDDAISKLAAILKSHQIPINIKLKIINLFNDLAIEQQTEELYSNIRSSVKTQEYKRLFESKIQSCGICKVIPSFLDLEDFDTHQKVIAAMMSLFSVCYEDFKSVPTNNRLHKLLKIYDPQSDDHKIDKNLQWDLYSEIKALYKRNNDESAPEFSLKTEL